MQTSLSVTHEKIHSALIEAIGKLPTMGPVLLAMMGPNPNVLTLLDETLAMRSMTRDDLPPTVRKFVSALLVDRETMTLSVRFPGLDYTLTIETK